MHRPQQQQSNVELDKLDRQRDELNSTGEQAKHNSPKHLKGGLFNTKQVFGIAFTYLTIIDPWSYSYSQ